MFPAGISYFLRGAWENGVEVFKPRLWVLCLEFSFLWKISALTVPTSPLLLHFQVCAIGPPHSRIYDAESSRLIVLKGDDWEVCWLHLGPASRSLFKHLETHISIKGSFSVLPLLHPAEAAHTPAWGVWKADWGAWVRFPLSAEELVLSLLQGFGGPCGAVEGQPWEPRLLPNFLEGTRVAVLNPEDCLFPSRTFHGDANSIHLGIRTCQKEERLWSEHSTDKDLREDLKLVFGFPVKCSNFEIS